jgi:bifunctional N-acetylglucosamine-1-phosphate-uridyltransferase/glucosamine-1-phosphate-acetyltransferase GlmU-like protein
LSRSQIAASIVFAAGKGSRMTPYEGNKTLLPLIPGASPFDGERPILHHILEQLPPGPKAVVVNHRKADIVQATRSMDLTFCEQPTMNGTGGALLAARPFIESTDEERVLITMGDVPFVRPETYGSLLDRLDVFPLVVLAFEPEDRRQYGLLVTKGPMVRQIVEWTYWRTFSGERLSGLRACNSGIYAARKADLLSCLERLAETPHTVVKDRNGLPCEIQEYFITDLVTLMAESGLETGYSLVADEVEVMGIDDPEALRKAQRLFAERPAPPASR